MIKLRERTAQEAFERHQHTPIRTYDHGEGVHISRILTARQTLGKLLAQHSRPNPVHKRYRIIELGCGMADISGFFSWGHDVTGYESTVSLLPHIGRRWPWMDVQTGDIQTIEPVECDFLILCEILEHLADPEGLLKRWMPKAEYALISSPLEEHKIDLKNKTLRDHQTGAPLEDLSGGEHIWSFEKGDFERMILEAGHSILDASSAMMGSLPIWMGVSRRQAVGP